MSRLRTRFTDPRCLICVFMCMTRGVQDMIFFFLFFFSQVRGLYGNRTDPEGIGESVTGEVVSWH